MKFVYIRADCSNLGRTSVFAGRCSTSEGSQTPPKKRSSTKVVEKSTRICFANDLREKNLISSFPAATWRRFWSPRRAFGRAWDLFLASWGGFGGIPGALGVRRGRPETLPRHLQDALRRHGASRESPRTNFVSMLGALGLLLDRFWIDFRIQVLFVHVCADLYRFVHICTDSCRLRRFVQICTYSRQIAPTGTYLCRFVHICAVVCKFVHIRYNLSSALFWILGNLCNFAQSWIEALQDCQNCLKLVQN